MNKKLFILLYLGFFITTILGVLSHEFGHYLAARFLGYEAKIKYNYTYITSANESHPFSEADNFLFLFGGPLQTMLTGTLGLALLYYHRKSFLESDKLNIKQWVLVFLALFWLRQIANFFISIGEKIIGFKSLMKSDEINIARYLGLPSYSVSVATTVIAILIVAVVLFKFVPKNQQLVLIIACLTGGISGFIFWMVLVGKHILP